MRFLFATILVFSAAAISAQAIAQTPTEAPGPFFPALTPTLGGNNLWGQNANNFENGCLIPLVGSTFTPNCAVNFITITGPGQTIAAPTFTIPSGAIASQVKKSIELVITYSGSYVPAFAAPPAYVWPVGAPPVQCGTVVNGTAVTTGCLSAVAGVEDWIECRSKGISGRVGCAPPLTSMGVVPYTGVGDIVAGATSYWGLRAYNAAVAAAGTQKSINIRRASDSTNTDINILTTGLLDVATATTFCAGTTCTVPTFYDQTGHGYNLTNATPANQPLFVLNCTPNGQPCLQFSSTTWLANAAYTALSQPFNMSAVVKHTGNFGVVSQIITSTSITQMGFDSGANTVFCYAGSFVDETAADNSFHSIQCTFSDAAVASATNVDGTDFATTLGTQGIDTGIGIGGTTSGQMGAQVTESGVWPTTAFSSAQRSSVSANQRGAWGF